MQINGMNPEGLSKWSDEDWSRFAQSVQPDVEGNYRRKYYGGSFGGSEVAMLAALAKGWIKPEDLAGVYGFGSIDMMLEWRRDLENPQLVDHTLDELGVNDKSFIEKNYVALRACLGIQ